LPLYPQQMQQTLRADLADLIEHDEIASTGARYTGAVGRLEELENRVGVVGMNAGIDQRVRLPAGVEAQHSGLAGASYSSPLCACNSVRIAFKVSAVLDRRAGAASAA
jgi:hypothetical protein